MPLNLRLVKILTLAFNTVFSHTLNQAFKFNGIKLSLPILSKTILQQVQ